MYQNQIKNFEFYYLSELTKQKIKPLSRFEKQISRKEIRWLKKQGLFVELIRRKALNGNRIIETIFSTSNRYIQFYSNRFENTLLYKNSDEIKLEGFLFGYPSCCVHQFIQKPYILNHLPKSDQSLLFHWACPHCRITPELIPYYQPVYKSVKDWYDSEILTKNVFRNKYKRNFQTAIAVALITGGLVSAQTSVDTAHYIPLPGDINNDGLSYAEEIYLGTYEIGLLNDCQKYAILFHNIIDSLPDSIQTDKTYKIDYLMRGQIQCPACGDWVNMGYVHIVNPMRNLEIELPYMALHFMENGYFSYGSNEAFTRVDIDTLKRILFPYNPDHRIPIENDLDGDGISNVYEDSLWMGYSAETEDYDNNGIIDGPQIAEELIRLFPKLKETNDGIHSYVKFKPTWGTENCQICGSIHNMGTVEITNPENNRKYEVPFLALHAMAHGSFAYNGEVHPDTTADVVKLCRAMKTHTLFIANDSDSDGLTDEEEDYFGLNSEKMDSDNDGVTDAKNLALIFADSIKFLPTEVSTTHSYIEYLDMDGVHLCSVCGKEIPMGIMKIYNPHINTIDPLEISYYAFHFLQCGSFAREGAENGRIDPIKLAEYLNNIAMDINTNDKNNFPAEFTLEQNYPNPFNATTKIQYRLNKAVKIELNIFNLTGEKVAVLFNGKQDKGIHTLTFNAENLSSGIYIYQLKSEGRSIAKKMLLTK